MYMLDSAKLLPLGVCSIYKITGTEHLLNPFLSQYIIYSLGNISQTAKEESMPGLSPV